MSLNPLEPARMSGLKFFGILFLTFVAWFASNSLMAGVERKSMMGLTIGMSVKPAAMLATAALADAATPDAAKAPAGAEGAAHPATEEHHEHQTPKVAIYWAVPFIGLLACIAIMPLFFPHFWHHHYPKVSIGLGAVVAVYYLFFYHHADHGAASLTHSRAAWIHEMQEYISFLALLGSLYMVSGGIIIGIERKGTPMTNVLLLAVGAVIANIFGTTGAAMLLIRPFIRINRGHVHAYHIVFFIFIVANVGGCLTPIGDPPLFMGYLKGVPFIWMLEHAVLEWAMAVGILLAVFFALDTADARKRAKEHADPEPVEGRPAPGPPVSMQGAHNLLFIGLILFAVFRKSMFEVGLTADILLSREVLMVAAGLLSKLLTPGTLYAANEFSYAPIKEVAYLFVGIFSTMVPALNWLNNNANSIPLNSPTPYYFITGSLSAVLDNAPTYLVFLESKRSKLPAEDGGQHATNMKSILHALNVEKKPDGLKEPELKRAYEQAHKAGPAPGGKWTDDQVTIAYLTTHPTQMLYLLAISLGAVYFGACTYIGNGPNFMVKAIAEEAGVDMPSFFGYVIKYTLPVLVPIYVLLWYLFFYLKAAG